MGDTIIKVLIHKDVFDLLLSLRRRSRTVHEEEQDQSSSNKTTTATAAHEHNNNNNDDQNNKSNDDYTKMELRFGADSTLRDVIDIISSKIASFGGCDSSNSIPSMVDKKDNTETNGNLVLHSLLLTTNTTTTSNSSSSIIVDDDDDSNSNHQKLMLMDCTYHPPTELIYSNINNQTVGSNSITLYKLKWFPSATIVLLSRSNKIALQEVMTSKLSTMELGTFQDASSTNSTAAMASITPSSSNNKPLPSQVFQAVQSRFENDDNDNSQDTADPTVARKRLKDTLKEKEQRRCQRLDEMLKNLNSKSNSKTSVKVREMLMKSRANGLKSLRQEDRVYLQVVLMTEDLEEDNDNTTNTQQTQKEEFIFVSRYASIGKVIESTTTKELMGTSQPSTEYYQEFLVKRQDHYWRLPNTCIINDAIQQDYIKPFEQMIVRQVALIPPTSVQQQQQQQWIMSPSITELTSVPSVEEMQEEEQQTTTTTNNTTSAFNSQQHDINNDDQNNANASLDNEASIVDYRCYDDAIEQYLASSNTKKTFTTKKSSASSQKVREMLIKSKALGDKKRIKDVSERLFLEVIVFDVDHTKVLSIKPHFFSQSRDTLQHLLEQVIDSKPEISNSYTLMVRRRDDKEGRYCYYTIGAKSTNGASGDTSSTSFQTLLKDGLMKQFDQVLIIPSSNKTST